MNTIKDIVLIKAEKDKKALHKVEGTDITLQIPTHFREYDHDIATQDGIVYGVPLMVTGNKQIEIKEGDHVYCHHFLTNEEHKMEYFGEDIYQLQYDSIYCKIVDGEIETIGKWNLLEIVNEEEEKTKSGLIVNANPKVIEGIAIMRYPSKAMQEEGVVDGVKIKYNSGGKRNAGYVILVEGKKYYRIGDDDIIMAYGQE